MTYNDAVQYLKKSYMFGSRQESCYFKKLLKNLGFQEERLQFIHIAGTNGKGSISTMIASILQEQGYKVGLFTSPHIMKYNERIKVNSLDISDDDLARYVGIVSTEIGSMFKNQEEYFSFFEITTAVAFLYFSHLNVDFVVLETGLGGRLDATNVISKPLVSVITSIGIDHTNFLGNTIIQTAKEKAGIIKAGCPVVLYPMQDEVFNVVYTIANSLGSKVYYDNPVFENNHSDFLENTFTVKGDYYEYRNIDLSLIGQYQMINASVALLTIEVLKRYKINFNSEKIYSGIQKASILARMQVVNKNPLVILDGAHNISAINQMVHEINYIKTHTDKKIVILSAMLKDKHYKDMIKTIQCVADFALFTQCSSDRSITVDEISNSLHINNKLLIKDFRDAYENALNYCDHQILICCGSFYFISDIISYLGRNR